MSEREQQLTEALQDLEQEYLRLHGCFPLPQNKGYAAMTKARAALADRIEPAQPAKQPAMEQPFPLASEADIKAATESVLVTLRERLDNCMLIAEVKSGNELDGWLADAAEYSEAIHLIERLTDQDRGEPAQPVARIDAANGQIPYPHIVRLRRID